MAKLRLLIWIMVIVAILAALIVWLRREKPIEVTLAEVERGEIQRTVTNTRAGTLNACRRAELSPSIGGQIANLPVKEGETVTTGQLLFEIWNQDLRAQQQLAQSELRASQARQAQCGSQTGSRGRGPSGRALGIDRGSLSSLRVHGASRSPRSRPGS